MISRLVSFQAFSLVVVFGDLGVELFASLVHLWRPVATFLVLGLQALFIFTSPMASLQVIKTAGCTVYIILLSRLMCLCELEISIFSQKQKMKQANV